MISHNDLVMPRSTYDVTYPLMSRGWNLQERLLSRRILHFTDCEFLFECKTTLFCECGCISQEFIGLGGNNSPKIGFERAMADISRASESMPMARYPQTKATTVAWTMIIAGYSTRQLTYSSDKLPAISGVGRKFSLPKTTGSPESRTYLAGLWLEDLPWLLCWRAFSWTFEKRSEVYCAPTWSWASLATPVIWDFNIFDTRSKIEVINNYTVPQGQDQLGQVRSGNIALRGAVQKARIDFEVSDDRVLGLRNGRGERVSFVLDHNRLGLPSDEDTEKGVDLGQRGAFSLRDGEEVACLWVLHNPANDGVWGLVLASPSEESISRSASGCELATVFERIGVITQMPWK